MKTGTGVRHYKSHSDYLQNRGKQASELISKELGEKLAPASKPDKVQLSDAAKEKKAEIKDHIKENGKEIKRASKHLLADAAQVAKGAVNLPGIGSALDIVSAIIPDNKIVQEVKEVVSPREEVGVADGARVIFVSGLHLAGISSDDEGLQRMAKDLEGAEHYTWKDEDEIISKVRSTPKEEPVILVGHSLGGDAIVNIANKLNTFSNGFRKIDLLVTLDSVGFDNDIIPKNVKKNINYIGNKDVLFNDGPNIARDNIKTEVINNLRKENHRQIDDSQEVRETIYNEVSEIMKSRSELQEQEDLMKSFISKIMSHPNALSILK
ncbi:hypothetical protein [Halobacteriovorax sp.]|uniref:hypothetical protein n=1 Tax=Halobacteriovorax sp. TaxID=2020862 RepID=UPI003562AF66